MTTDPFNLRRFVEAQDLVYRSVIAELRAGVKQSHWMWFVFPQVAGLGHSAMADKYAIASLDEAKAYLAHPLLGARLKECTELVLAVTGKTARQILGSPDDMKFRSSMTLFAQAAPNEPLFRDALKKYFDGKDDPATLERI
ncbi:MAG TPA: DUF1810 domain-containing protein [Rhizomicrobium sp.]|nr:DUF1810 domain-containing protein [Rhizomicrobium sp.]